MATPGAAAPMPIPKSVETLAGDYRAVREAMMATSPVPVPPDHPLDFSPLGFAYQSLKQRNHLAVLINRALRRPVVRALPIEVQINNIGFCNLRCPHCPTHGTDEQHAIYQSKSHTMTRSAAEKIVAETFAHTKKVCTSGTGEGLLHKDLDAIVDGAARYGVQFFTNTNGTTLLPNLVGGLFGIAELRLSIDGATPVVFEAVRRGAKYQKVMRNVLAVTRANERLPPTLRLVPSVNFGICASNARDVPVMVDLCAFLGLSAIHAFRIVPLNPKYAEDDIEKYPAYYKHYYLEAMQRARARNLLVNLPAPDPNVEPDANAGPRDAGMIVTGVDDAYYARLPNFERLIDTAGLEEDIQAMMQAALEAGIRRHSAARPTAVREAAERARALDAELAGELQRGFSGLSPSEAARVRAMHQSDKPVADCFFIQAHLIYNADGAVRPCCDTDIEPIGDSSTDPRELLAGPPLQRLAGEFASGQLRPDCRRCSMSRTVPERMVFPVALS